MAQSISLMGATYSDVPAVLLPKSGSGTARFDDCSLVTATAADVASGKIFVASDGTITTGTASGAWTKIGNTTEMAADTTSTTATSAGTISCGSSIYTKDKILYVRVRDKAGKRAGYFIGSDTFIINTTAGNGSTSTHSQPLVLCHRYTSSSTFESTVGSYGVYGVSVSSGGTLTIRKRYSSQYSLTVNSTYLIDVFLLDYPSGYPCIFDITAVTTT